jgi:hypothetical protein
MSKSNEMYKQGVLTKPSENGGTITRVFWGPEKYMIPGRLVKVEEDDGTWTEGWTVKSASGQAMPKDIVVHQSHAHTRQRKASDI